MLRIYGRHPHRRLGFPVAMLVLIAVQACSTPPRVPLGAPFPLVRGGTSIPADGVAAGLELNDGLQGQELLRKELLAGIVRPLERRYRSSESSKVRAGLSCRTPGVSCIRAAETSSRRLLPRAGADPTRHRAPHRPGGGVPMRGRRGDLPFVQVHRTRCVPANPLPATPQRQKLLAPGTEGVPLEVYCFSKSTEWAVYEGLQADLFDHFLAIAPEFGLRIFQQPAGSDLAGLAGGTRSAATRVDPAPGRPKAKVHEANQRRGDTEE